MQDKKENKKLATSDCIERKYKYRNNYGMY